MSTAVSDGSIEKFDYTAGGKNHSCWAWKIDDIHSKIETGEMKSPIFTICNGEECKWYLSLQSIYGSCSDESAYIFSVRLIFDRERSDCKEVVAKFKLNILKKREMNKSNLQLGTTYDFVSKSENSAGILVFFRESELCVDQSGWYYLKIIYEIMIEDVLEDVIPNKNHTSLQKDFGILLKSQSLSDIVISVGGKFYPAHKTILAARSSVFASMFANDMAENRSMVHIKDMNEDIVEEMLRYIYSEKVEKFEDLVNDLLKAADKYNLQGLQSKCEDFLITTLSSSNVFEILLLAESCNAKKLKSEAINFIAIKSTQLMKTSAWENICQSNPQLLREITEAVLQSKFTTDESK